MNILRIQGNRQTGKSTLLAHFIKDAQKIGKKVLLTGRQRELCRNLQESRNVKADYMTTSLLTDKTGFDVLAIEEIDVTKVKEYQYKYTPNMNENFITIITGN